MAAMHQNSPGSSQQVMNEDIGSLCFTCGKHFKNRETLRQHVAAHQELGPYKCCGKTYRSHTHLTRHRCNVHGDTKQFTCNNCGRSFAVKCDLNRHQRRETGQFRFKCQYCGLKLESASKLNDHQAVHANVVGAHRCTICFKTFSFRNNLSRHMNTIHSK